MPSATTEPTGHWCGSSRPWPLERKWVRARGELLNSPKRPFLCSTSTSLASSRARGDVVLPGTLYGLPGVVLESPSVPFQGELAVHLRATVCTQYTVYHPRPASIQWVYAC